MVMHSGSVEQLRLDDLTAETSLNTIDSGDEELDESVATLLLGAQWARRRLFLLVGGSIDIKPVLLGQKAHSQLGRFRTLEDAEELAPFLKYVSVPPLLDQTRSVQEVKDEPEEEDEENWGSKYESDEDWAAEEEEETAPQANFKELFKNFVWIRFAF